MPVVSKSKENTYFDLPGDVTMLSVEEIWRSACDFLSSSSDSLKLKCSPKSDGHLSIQLIEAFRKSAERKGVSLVICER